MIQGTAKLANNPEVPNSALLKPRKKSPKKKKSSNKVKGNKQKKVKPGSPNEIDISKKKKKDKTPKKHISKEEILKKHVKEEISMLEHKNSHINLLGKRFKIEDELLGFGSFGRTYLGTDMKKNRNVAIKIMLKKRSMDSFLREATVLKCVNFTKAAGFPQMLMSAYNEDICILVEELLGMNLEVLRKKHGKLSYATIAAVGIQLLNRIEGLHHCGFIHRDIKPQNICLGGNQGGKHDHTNKVYLIDFGLAMQYLDENGHHYKPSPGTYSSVVGTALFASINAHNGKDLSRRDDIEELIYTLLYLCAGSVPWKNINCKKKKERHQLIMYLKEEISSNQQFMLKQDVPIELFHMLQYSQSLQFEEEPDYKYLKSLLQKIIKRNYKKIKKMNDIDILNNNNEDVHSRSFSKFATQEDIMMKGLGQGGIDVSQIAFQIGCPNQDVNTNNHELIHSVASNEQLVFKTELNGGTNHMNTNDREEISNKLNPAMYRSLFTVASDECIPKHDKLISEIPEEEDESDSYGNELEDDDEDMSHEGGSHDHQFEEIKVNDTVQNKSFNSGKGKNENDDDDDNDYDDEDVIEDDIPDDLEVCPQIQSYFLKANDNHLTDKKGHNTQSMIQDLR